MLTNLVELLPMLLKSSAVRVPTYTFLQFVFLLFILGIMMFFLFDDDDTEGGAIGI